MFFGEVFGENTHIISSPMYDNSGGDDLIT